MGYTDKCRGCWGTGKRWDESACAPCKGTGKVQPYRVKPNLSDGAKLGWNEMLSWPRFGRDKHCEVCDKPLTGRKRSFCSDSCRRWHMCRIYMGIHWQKRLVAVRDGCACRSCGEVFESPIVEGGNVYPDVRQLELDHIVPLRRGGDETPANCQLLCETCHSKKTAKERRSA